jgi:hypothetical protein
VKIHRTASSRRGHIDLLTTSAGLTVEDRWAALLIDPVAQLEELSDLVDRGLVSPEEFQRQRTKIFGV